MTRTSSGSTDWCTEWPVTRIAADFTQETFIRAFDRLEQFRGDSSLATWLHTIAVSVALNGCAK
jgi:DNA-directed RNA polymerase specialized sigma24 family protein